MLTVPQAARRVRRNPETVRRWIREGKLASQRVGTQHLIEEDAIDALVIEDPVIPSRFDETSVSGEPMPNFLGALYRSRTGQ